MLFLSPRKFEPITVRSKAKLNATLPPTSLFGMTSRAPLQKTLIRIVPLAFVVGASMELFMAYVPVGNETFYDTAKRLEAQRKLEKQKSMDELRRRVKERQRREATAFAEDKPSD